MPNKYELVTYIKLNAENIDNKIKNLLSLITFRILTSKGVMKLRGKLKALVPLSASVAVTMCEELISLVRHLHSSAPCWTATINEYIDEQLRHLPSLMIDVTSQVCDYFRHVCCESVNIKNFSI